MNRVIGGVPLWAWLWMACQTVLTTWLIFAVARLRRESDAEAARVNEARVRQVARELAQARRG